MVVLISIPYNYCRSIHHFTQSQAYEYLIFSFDLEQWLLLEAVKCQVGRRGRGMTAISVSGDADENGIKDVRRGGGEVPQTLLWSLHQDHFPAMVTAPGSLKDEKDIKMTNRCECTQKVPNRQEMNGAYF